MVVSALRQEAEHDMTLNTRESLGPIWPKVYADTVRRGNTQTYEEFIAEMKEDQLKRMRKK